MIRLCRIDDLSYLPRSTLTGRLGRVWTASIPDYSRWSGSASTRNIAPSPIACPCAKRPSTRACKRRRRATGCTFSPFVVYRLTLDPFGFEEILCDDEAGFRTAGPVRRTADGGEKILFVRTHRLMAARLP